MATQRRHKKQAKKRCFLASFFKDFSFGKVTLDPWGVSSFQLIFATTLTNISSNACSGAALLSAILPAPGIGGDWPIPNQTTTQNSFAFVFSRLIVVIRSVSCFFPLALWRVRFNSHRTVVFRIWRFSLSSSFMYYALVVVATAHIHFSW